MQRSLLEKSETRRERATFLSARSISGIIQRADAQHHTHAIRLLDNFWVRSAKNWAINLGFIHAQQDVHPSHEIICGWKCKTLEAFFATRTKSPRWELIQKFLKMNKLTFVFRRNLIRSGFSIKDKNSNSQKLRDTYILEIFFLVLFYANEKNLKEWFSSKFWFYTN